MGEMLKKRLIYELVKKAEIQKMEVEGNYRKAQERANEAEGAMKSRYDTFKEEAQYLAEALRLRSVQVATDLEKAKYVMNFEKIKKDKKVQVLSVVMLELCDMQKKYFLFPVLAGVEIDDYVIITPFSPLGKSLLGKEAGDEFCYMVNESPKNGIIISII